MAIFDIFRSSRRSADNVQPATDANATTVPWQYDIKRGDDEVTTKELALRIAAVYRCADILSKGVAQLPLEIKHDLGGYFKDDTDDVFGLSYLLKWKPNDRLSAFEFKRSMMLQIIFQGNAYIVPEMGPHGFQRLVLCSPNTVTYNKVNNEYVIADVFNGISGTYTANQVIHIRNLGVDGGMTGISTLQYAGRVLAISSNGDRANVTNFKNGGLLRGFVSGKGGQAVGFGVVQDSQISGVADKLAKQLAAGADIIALPDEMSFSPIAISPKDIELLSTKQFNVLEICRFFGVHPDKVFAQQSTNYKASEMNQVSFLTDTLQPYLTQIEMEFQVKLIPRTMVNEYRIDFDIEPLMQTDLGTKAEYLTKMLANGGYTVNDVRKSIGRAPFEGGDTPLVSANLLSLDSAKAKAATI